jgi:hypothetical protein
MAGAGSQNLMWNVDYCNSNTPHTFSQVFVAISSSQIIYNSTTCLPYLDPQAITDRRGFRVVRRHSQAAQYRCMVDLQSDLQSFYCNARRKSYKFRLTMNRRMMATSICNKKLRFPVISAIFVTT